MPSRIFTSRFVSDSPDEIEAFTTRVFGTSTRWEGGVGGATPRANFSGCALGGTRIMEVKLEHYSVSRTLENSLQLIIPMVGSLRRLMNGSDTAYGSQSSLAVVTQSGQKAKFCIEDGTGLIVSLPQSDLLDRARMLTGSSAVREEFTGADLDLRSPYAATLTRTVAQALSETTRLSALGLDLTPLATYEHLIGDMLAYALCSELQAAAEAETPESGTPLVRTACEYIVAHSSDAIDLAALARQLGVSARSLQKGFRRYMGMSPRDFLLSCRLDRARELLCAPVGLNVTAVAFDSGFTDLSFFANKYREKFGELPSDTIRRNRRE